MEKQHQVQLLKIPVLLEGLSEGTRGLCLKEATPKIREVHKPAVGSRAVEGGGGPY